MDLQDLNNLLIGHMRWAMTKQTFAPYISYELLMRYSGYLSISQKEDMVKFIKSCLQDLKTKESILSDNNKTDTSCWEKLILNLESKIFDEPSEYKIKL